MCSSDLFSFGSEFEVEIFSCSSNHIINMVADLLNVFRVGDMQIVFGCDCIFRMEVIHGVIKCFELFAFYFKIPVRHAYSLEGELHFVVSFFKFFIQLMKFGDILSESGISYVVTIFVFLEWNTYDITILPGFIIQIGRASCRERV